MQVSHVWHTVMIHYAVITHYAVLTQYYVKHMYAGEYDISALHLAALHGHTDTVER